MVKSSTTSITPAQHADRHRHGGTDPLTGDVRIDGLEPFTTMTDEVGSRANNTNYQNTSGHTMKVVIRGTIGAAVDFIGYIKATTPADTTVFSQYNSGIGGSMSMELIVPDNYYYRVLWNGAITSWYEYV